MNRKTDVVAGAAVLGLIGALLGAAVGSHDTPSEKVPDKRLELAYEAGAKALAMQDVTLGSVRSRANNLLSTAALFTSVSTAIGLINTDPSKGHVLAPWKALVLVSVVALLGICVVFVLWTANNWQFGADPQQIMDEYDTFKDESAIRILVIRAMVTGLGTNGKKLKWRQRAFRSAAALLVVEGCSG
jgi:hypothetical protein